MRRAALLAAVCAGLAATAGHAQDFGPALDAFLQTDIAPWASDPILVAAITAQNQVTAAYDQAMIDGLDATWRAEIGTAQTPTIDAVLSNPAADFLRDRIAASGGRITEAFVMDAQGLNVGASSITSDYWQGDEDKHALTYDLGPGAVLIGDVELDESTQTYQAQVSITVTDPATGLAVGALTVGINAEALM